MSKLRIVSLLPAATEIVYALGLEDYLVGVSDDSDFPPQVRNIPKVVTTTLPQNLTSRQIDDRVRAAKHRGVGIFHVDQELLKKLKPNLILSQELCEVCAIGASEIRRAARILKNPTRTVSLEPETIENVMENILLIGSLTGKNREAEEIVRKLKKRLSVLSYQLSDSGQSVFSRSVSQTGKQKTGKPDSENRKPKTDNRKRVLIIEWVDPIMVAGHWVPEMVKLAGGVNLISKKGEVSKRIPWQQVFKENPDVLIISPCGFDIERTMQEMNLLKNRKDYNALKAVRNKSVFLVDGNAYLTRPGPRIVDGIEILSEIIHSEVFKREYSKKDWTVLY